MIFILVTEIGFLMFVSFLDVVESLKYVVKILWEERGVMMG